MKKYINNRDRVKIIRVMSGNTPLFDRDSEYTYKNMKINEYGYDIENDSIRIHIEEFYVDKKNNPGILSTF